jgi:hypothetical protein
MINNSYISSRVERLTISIMKNIKAVKKVLLTLILATFAVVSIYSQSITTIGYTFRIVNDFGKSMTGKQVCQTDYIKNDTARFIKIIFQDQVKVYNNGYIIINSKEKLQQFISDLELLMPKLNTEEVITIPRPSYKLDINNPENRLRFQRNLNKRICIYEPNSTAFIGFKEDKLLQLVANLKKISW